YKCLIMIDTWMCKHTYATSITDPLESFSRVNTTRLNKRFTALSEIFIKRLLLRLHYPFCDKHLGNMRTANGALISTYSHNLIQRNGNAKLVQFIDEQLIPCLTRCTKLT